MNSFRKYCLSSIKNGFLFPYAYFGGIGGIYKPGYLLNKHSLNISNSLYLLITSISPKLSLPFR